MVFESLYEALQRKELILVEGGMCRFHHRPDGQLTIHEILSSASGAGSKILKILEDRRPLFILAKCPADLQANTWYKKKGFQLQGSEITRSKRKINIWVKYCLQNKESSQQSREKAP